jgi:hypothetical protein
MNNKLKTAIVFFPDGKTVWKLRNVGNVERFLQYGKSIGAKYVNFYDKETKLFIGQMYF